MMRISPSRMPFAAVLVTGLVVAAVTVPAAVWPERFSPAVAAALAIAVAMTAVAIVAGRLRRRTLAERLLAAELDATRAGATSAIVSVDTGGAIVDWSPGAAALYGYEAEDVVAQDVSLLWAGEGDADAATRLLDAMRGGDKVCAEEAVHRGKDGAEIFVSLTAVPIRGARGETAGAVLTATDVSESARTRALLDEVEAKYRSLTERLPVVPYVHELGNRGATLYIGPQVNELLGFSREDWMAQPDLFSRLVHPDDRQRVAQEAAAVHPNGQAFRSEYRMLSRDGRIVWVRDEAVTVRNAAGQPLFVQGYLADVGEGRRFSEERERLLAAERAATTESLSRQRKLDFMAHAVSLLASSSEYESTIRRVADLAVRDICDWCVVDLIEESAPLRFAIARGESASSVMEPGSEAEPAVIEVVRKGRPKLTASRIHAPLMARGRALGAVTLITEAPGRSYGGDDLALAQNLAEAMALAIDTGGLQREVEERADAARVLAHVGDGVFLVDRGGVIRLWNPAAETITGFAAASVLDHSVGEAIPGWQALVERIPVAHSREPVHAETLPLETEEGERWISISAVQFFGGTVFAFRDVTDDRRLQELKADFVATASHELRTPLAAVYGAAQTLRRHDFALDEAGRERFVSLIVDESDRLGRIVNEILLANQLEARQIDTASEPFEALDFLDRVIESVRTHAPPNIVLTIVAPGSTPLVLADRDKVRQVVVNLVENAIKYSPDGGLIEVGVKEEDSVVRFSVRDEGLGIPSEEQERIFEKFYRLDPAMTRGVGGTGLGLYICNELIERMGGRIWVESESGEGSTFFFELPRAEAPPSRILTPEAGKASAQD
jgi:two-component system, OmpR family, phosphate regulon sensor histidine kinase PhoR